MPSAGEKTRFAYFWAVKSKAGCGAQRPRSTEKIRTRGFRPPTTTYFLYMPKESRQRKGTQLPCPPLRSGFPALRRRFGDRQKLASLRHLPVFSPKRPLRSGCGRWEAGAFNAHLHKSAHAKADQEHRRSAREGSCFLCRSSSRNVHFSQAASDGRKVILLHLIRTSPPSPAPPKSIRSP
jgi:hypothetical protein